MYGYPFPVHLEDKQKSRNVSDLALELVLAGRQPEAAIEVARKLLEADTDHELGMKLAEDELSEIEKMIDDKKYLLNYLRSALKPETLAYEALCIILLDKLAADPANSRVKPETVSQICNSLRTDLADAIQAQLTLADNGQRTA